MTEIGHNSAPAAAENLRHLTASIEKLDDQRALITEEIKELFDEAKAFGFDTKIFRAVLRRRKMEREKLAEFDELIAKYERALEGGGK